MLDDFDEILTSKEAAEILGMAQGYVAELCASGKLPGAVKKGKTWLIPKSSVLAYKIAHPKNKNGKNGSSVPADEGIDNDGVAVVARAKEVKQEKEAEQR